MSFLDKLLYLTNKVPPISRRVANIRAITQDILRGFEALRQLVESPLSLSTRDTIFLIQSDPLPTNTASFDSGIRVLEATANGALTIDGEVEIWEGDSVLVCGEADARNNGVYEVITVGDGSNPWKLQRSSGYRTGSAFTAFRTFFAISGTVNTSHPYRMTSPEYPRVDHDPIVFEKLSITRPGQIWAGSRYLYGGPDEEAAFYPPPYGTYRCLFFTVDVWDSGTVGDVVKMVRRRSDNLVETDYISVDISSASSGDRLYPNQLLSYPVFAHVPGSLSFIPVFKTVNGSGEDFPPVEINFAFIRMG